MLELVFVIVVIGILSAVFIPKFGQNKLSEAANQLISHIRYTQHLALMDDKFDSNDVSWFLRRWEIAFSGANGTKSYFIFSDSPSGAGTFDGNPKANATYTNVEVATNPLNKNNYLIGTAYSTFDNSHTERLSPELDIGKKYGIKDVIITGGNIYNNDRILFDHLGRPYRGTTASTAAHQLSSPQDGLATSKIYIKLCRSTCTGSNLSANNNNEAVIVIEPETGYIHLL